MGPEARVVFPHADDATASTSSGDADIDGVAQSTEALIFATIHKGGSRAVEFILALRRAECIAPEALTRIASSHSGQRVGFTLTVTVEYASVRPDSAADIRHPSVTDA